MSSISHSLCEAQKGKVTTLIFYVDDSVVTSDDQYKINNLNGFLGKEFDIKD